MLTIDGSFGEGGGQILRTSVALAALQGCPIKVVNIRARRRNPGLQPQHISAVEAIGKLCNATITGLKIGSVQIEFDPGEIKGANLFVDVKTAGAISLILQALLLAACGTKGTIEIVLIGGTDVPWSPPADYLRWVTLYFLDRLGYPIKMNLVKRGFYPKGGGRIETVIHPAELRKIEILNPGRLKKIFGISYAEKRLSRSQVAERQKNASLDFLKEKFPQVPINIEIEYSASLSLGSGVVLVAETEAARLGASALGEKGKRAEIVGSEAASSLYKEVLSEASLDSHMADQIVPYLALAGGQLRVGEITQHTITNIEVVRKFGFKVNLRDNLLIAPGRL